MDNIPGFIYWLVITKASGAMNYSSKHIVGIILLSILTLQCDLFPKDHLENPNQISDTQADPDLLLNNIQIDFKDAYRSAAHIGALNTRMKPMFGETFDHAFIPRNFNGIYETSYTKVLIDANHLLDIAEQRGMYFHAGMAKVLKAYTLIMMVDLFGDLPYSEAIMGGKILNPSLDPGKEIYEEAIELLKQAKVDLANSKRTAMPQNALYFSGLSKDEKEDSWIRTANTILLKAYLNMGHLQEINELIAENRFINSPEFDFIFRYSTQSTNPDSRHPDFVNNYREFASELLAVNYMNMLVNNKSEHFIRDPRTRYYFYRKRVMDIFPHDNPCWEIVGQPPAHFDVGDPWCFIENGEGYYGRDFLNPDHPPTHSDIYTTYGVYSAGGLFDAAQGLIPDTDMGYQGAGFEPILMSSFTHFMLAEAALKLGTEGDSWNYLETAIRQSMETVRDFGADQAEELFGEITDEQIEDYVSVVYNRWNDPEYDKIRAISMEYYLALWPNGYEAYNMMRRTGHPNRLDNLQPAATANPGSWYYSLYYPENMVNRNKNVDQKTRDERVFWNQDATHNFDF